MSEDAFPDVRWGNEPPSAVKRPIIALLSTKFGALCMSKLASVDRELLRRSNGRLTIFGPVGIPLLLLTTIGRKSGERREIPLTYMREGDRLFQKCFCWTSLLHDGWKGNRGGGNPVDGHRA